MSLLQAKIIQICHIKRVTLGGVEVPDARNLIILILN